MDIRWLHDACKNQALHDASEGPNERLDTNQASIFAHMLLKVWRLSQPHVRQQI